MLNSSFFTIYPLAPELNYQCSLQRIWM